MSTRIDEILALVEKSDFQGALDLCDTLISESMAAFMEELTVNLATDYVGSVLLYSKICALIKKPWKATPKMDTSQGALRFLEDFIADKNILSETFHSYADAYAYAGFLPEAIRLYYKEALYASELETKKEALSSFYYYQKCFGKKTEHDLSFFSEFFSKKELDEIKKNAFKEAESRILTDPIEMTDAFLQIRYEIENEIEKSLSENKNESLPYFANYWNEKKRILNEKFGIQWKSPVEMNPNIRFY